MAMDDRQSLKVLVFFVGTRGDVLPGVAICKALEERGHQAAMASTPGMEDSIRAYGVRCHVVGNIPFTWRDDTKVLSAEELFTMRRSMDVKEFVKLINKHGVSWNLEESLPDAMKGCKELLDEEHFDVLLCNFCTSSAGVRLMQGRSLQVIRTSYSFWQVPTSAWPPAGYTMSNGFMNKLKHFHYLFCIFFPFIMGSKMFKRELERVQEIQGVDHGADLSFFKKISRTPCLGLWSPSLQEKPKDFPENMEVTGYIAAKAPLGWAPTAALKAFLERRPVLLSFGSMMGTRQLEEVVVKALRAKNLPVLWCSDQNRQKEAVTCNFGFAPGGAGEESAEGVYQVDYVPFDYVLPKVSLVVCHGGSGTLFGALKAGVPVVVCPLVTPIICDQMLHAEWLERRGLGAFLRPLEPSLEDCAVALSKAMACRAACEDVARQAAGEDGAAATALAVERLATRVESRGCCAGVLKLLRGLRG